MLHLTEADIRAHLASLALPPGGLGELESVASRLCSIQQTLTPVATPRRLVLFAADHGSSGESQIAPTMHNIVSGGAACSVLAKTANTDLVLVDVGSRSDPLPDTPRYRCRRVRSGSRDMPRPPALTPEELCSTLT